MLYVSAVHARIIGLWPAGKLESCWQDQTPADDSVPCPIAKHIISTASTAHHYQKWKGKVHKPCVSVQTGTCWGTWPDEELELHSLCQPHCWQWHNLYETRGRSWSQSKHAHKQKLSALLSVRVAFTRRLCLSVTLHPLLCHIFQQWPFAQTAIFNSHLYEMHWFISLVKHQYT